MFFRENATFYTNEKKIESKRRKKFRRDGTLGDDNKGRKIIQTNTNHGRKQGKDVRIIQVRYDEQQQQQRDSQCV